MQKRAGIARAMALDPEILFLDEPSAGLDPVTSRRLDELILELRDSLGATIVVVTHELASLLAIGDNSVFLDGGERRRSSRAALRATCSRRCPARQGPGLPEARREREPVQVGQRQAMTR